MCPTPRRVHPGHLPREKLPLRRSFFTPLNFPVVFASAGTSHGTWPTAAAATGYYPATSCNYGPGGSGMNGGTSADAMYHHPHHAHHQHNNNNNNNGGASYSPQGTAVDHHSLGWTKPNKDVTAATTWSPDNYS